MDFFDPHTLVDWKGKIGMLAGGLAMAAYLPYVVSILRKKTRPSRVTWLILSLVAFLTFLASYFVGSRNTLWLVIGDLSGISLVAILSIPYGVGGKDALDKICIVGAGIGILIWWISASATIGLMAMLLIDAVAMIPTITKTYRYPEDEDRLAWTMALVAHCLGIVALEKWVFAIAVYPFYLAVLSGTVLILTFNRNEEEAKNAEN